MQDDFLLRHYDKGPCKNKLGHSRASVIWHRTQVIGIFAGFGILLLVASPLLLLAAPCIVCCKCRVCSGSSKLDTEDEMQEESASWSVMHCLNHNFKIIQSFMTFIKYSFYDNLTDVYLKSTYVFVILHEHPFVQKQNYDSKLPWLSGHRGWMQCLSVK